ncbi:MAG: hypothetical protein QW838_02885 [Candidatus Nitrosotenuis sp.]
MADFSDILRQRADAFTEGLERRRQAMDAGDGGAGRGLFPGFGGARGGGGGGPFGGLFQNLLGGLFHPPGGGGGGPFGGLFQNLLGGLFRPGGGGGGGLFGGLFQNLFRGGDLTGDVARRRAMLLDRLQNSPLGGLLTQGAGGVLQGLLGRFLPMLGGPFGMILQFLLPTLFGRVGGGGFGSVRLPGAPPPIAPPLPPGAPVPPAMNTGSTEGAAPTVTPVNIGGGAPSGGGFPPWMTNPGGFGRLPYYPYPPAWWDFF